MEVSWVSSIIETRQWLAVPLDHFAVAYPFEHELIREDAFVVNPQSIFVEEQLDIRTIGCGLVGGWALSLPLSWQIKVRGCIDLLRSGLIHVHYATFYCEINEKL